MLRRTARSRLARLVVDGLALDLWLVVRDALAVRWRAWVERCHVIPKAPECFRRPVWEEAKGRENTAWSTERTVR